MIMMSWEEEYSTDEELWQLLAIQSIKDMDEEGEKVQALVEAIRLHNGEKLLTALNLLIKDCGVIFTISDREPRDETRDRVDFDDAEKELKEDIK